MLMFTYHVVWTIVCVCFLPILPFLTSKRFLKRCGLSLPSAPIKQGSIWIHALSVGEVLSALPLVKMLGEKYPHKDIVFSVTTVTGMDVAMKELEGGVKALVTMPLDFWWSVRRIVNRIRPSVFILVETDIWPALIHHLKKRGIKTILVNGRVSPRTFRSYRRFPTVTRMMLGQIESCLVQSDLDRLRLVRAGMDPGKIQTTGNIKFDHNRVAMSSEEHQKWLHLLCLHPGDPVWVAGSIHRGEEKVIFEVFKRLRPFFERLRLVLAPRNMECSNDFIRQARQMGFKTVLKTDLPEIGADYDVLIINTLGELARIYGISTVSFVGGSLVPVGGHNVLEPAGFGCPVVFGQYTYNFAEMSELLAEAGGGLRVKDGNELYKTMKMLLTESEKRAEIGEFARNFVEENRGVLERVVSHIADCSQMASGPRKENSDLPQISPAGLDGDLP